MLMDAKTARSNATVVRRFVIFSRVVGWLVLVSSLAMLMTWISGVGPLRPLVQTDVGMRACTAVLGVFAGSALLLSTGAPRASLVLSLLIAALGAFATLSPLTGCDAMSFHWLDAQLPAWPNRAPGRVSDLTGFSMVLLGIAGATMVWRRLTWLREACLLTTLAIAMATMASYGLVLAGDVAEMLNQLPLMTALLLLLMALGWMASAPRTGLTQISVADSFGGAFARRLILPALLLPILLTFLFKAVQSQLGMSQSLALALAAVATGGVVTVMIIWVAFLLDRSERQRRIVQALREEASTDALTGLANRRMFDLALANLIDSGAGMTLLMLDLDNFKRFNDSFGHPAGDEVLRTTGRLLREVVRDKDLAARYGGEEFAILLPAIDAKHAEHIGQRILEAFRDYPWPLRAVTISIGAAISIPDDSPETLLRRADMALYRSKQEGRDRLTFVAAPDEINQRLNTH